MAQPIRPPPWPPAPSNVSPTRPDARLSAQKAFFEAALGGKPDSPASAAAPSAPTVAPAQAVRSVVETEARAKDRLPPPGSTLNIVV